MLFRCFGEKLKRNIPFIDVGVLMVETFYVHLAFTCKDHKSSWSINLPFLCTKCGICCTLENFLTAGKINDPLNTRPDVHKKFKVLTEELGILWEQDPDKYDQYIINKLCPFLVDNICTIYAIRPEGCQLYPNTRFGLDSPECEPLTRFKKQKIALKRGNRCRETYHHTITDNLASIKQAKFNQKQLQACIDKLLRAGATKGELALFNSLNQ